MPTIDILLKRVEVLINQERYALAEKELYKLLAENPENADVVANLVRALTGSSKNTEALEWALKLLYLDPNRAYFYYLAAFVEVRLNLFDEAEIHIRRAIELEPEWAMNFEVLSRIYQHRGKYDDGLHYANEGLRQDPDHIDCLDARAFSLAMLGRQQEARQTIDHALSLEPENPYLRRDIGVAFSHLGDYTTAEMHLRETLRMDPISQDVKYQLGKAIRQKLSVFQITHRIKKLTIGFTQESNAQWAYKYAGLLLLMRILVFLLGFYFIFFYFKSVSSFNKGLGSLLLGMGVRSNPHNWRILFGWTSYLLFRLFWAPVMIIGNIRTVLRKANRELFTKQDYKTAYNQRIVLVFFPLLGIAYGALLHNYLFTLGILVIVLGISLMASLQLQKL